MQRLQALHTTIDRDDDAELGAAHPLEASADRCWLAAHRSASLSGPAPTARGSRPLRRPNLPHPKAWPPTGWRAATPLLQHGREAREGGAWNPRSMKMSTAARSRPLAREDELIEEPPGRESQSGSSGRGSCLQEGSRFLVSERRSGLRDARPRSSVPPAQDQRRLACKQHAAGGGAPLGADGGARPQPTWTRSRSTEDALPPGVDRWAKCESSSPSAAPPCEEPWRPIAGPRS